jgi:hypothetical protein
MGGSSAAVFGAKTTKLGQESSSESTPRLNFDRVPSGYIRDLITGRLRKRQKIDDFPLEITRRKYKPVWDELRMKERRERGYIEGYQLGDSELDFSEWEDAKKERR